MPTTPTYGLPYPVLSDPPNVPGDLQALAEAVDTTIASTDSDIAALDGRVTTLETDTAAGTWQTLSLTNGWVARAGYYVPSYRSLPGSSVELAGGLISGTATNGTVIGTVPVGYRPAADQPVPMLANNGSVYAIFVRTSGNLELFHSEAASPTFTAVYLMGTYPLSV